VSCGELGEEDKAINLLEIVVEKSTIKIRIHDFQVGGLTCLKMVLMLLGRMFPSEESR